MTRFTGTYRTPDGREVTIPEDDKETEAQLELALGAWHLLERLEQAVQRVLPAPEAVPTETAPAWTLVRDLCEEVRTLRQRTKATSPKPQP